MGEPPSVAGTDQARLTEPFPALAVTASGADGTVGRGVADASPDCAPTPAELIAATV